MNGRRLKDFSSNELFCGDDLFSQFCVYYCYYWLNDTKNVESKEALPTLKIYHSNPHFTHEESRQVEFPFRLGVIHKLRKQDFGYF